LFDLKLRGGIRVRRAKSMVHRRAESVKERCARVCNSRRSRKDVGEHVEKVRRTAYMPIKFGRQPWPIATLRASYGTRLRYTGTKKKASLLSPIN
jgi:hypothetical protein